MIEYRIVRPDGEVRWIEARGQMFLGADRRTGTRGRHLHGHHRAQARRGGAARNAAEALRAVEPGTRCLRLCRVARSARAAARDRQPCAWIEEDLVGCRRASRPKPRDARSHALPHAPDGALIEGILQYSRAGRVSAEGRARGYAPAGPGSRGPAVTWRRSHDQRRRSSDPRNHVRCRSSRSS